MYRHLADTDEAAFGSEFLDTILDWVEENLAPEEVYNEDKLKEWAKYGCDPLEIFGEDELREALGIEDPTDAT